MAKKTTNVQAILNYLLKHGPSTYTQLTQMLCAKNGKVWHRGYYSNYFSTPCRIFRRNTAKTSYTEKGYWCKSKVQVDKWWIGEKGWEIVLSE